MDTPTEDLNSQSVYICVTPPRVICEGNGSILRVVRLFLLKDGVRFLLFDSEELS